jgi:TolB protein
MKFVRALTMSVALAGALALAPGSALAVLHVPVDQGNLAPIKTAITPFTGQTQDEQQTGGDISNVITSDLERSGLFKAINPAAFIQRDLNMAQPPRFQEWRPIGAQALVMGDTDLQEDGRLRVDFRLWDVYQEKQLDGKRYFTTPENWRRISHIVADEIYTSITGERGYFDTRIVYVAESGPKINRVKRLAIMDQDGANPTFLTDGQSLVLTPRFSPNSQEITYLSYYGGRPRVYIFNIESGQQEVLGDFPGMTFAPRFSPDGKSVIMSLERNGNSEIYSMDLGTRKATRLTDNPAIDTAPSYSPDGKYVAFESDRSGTQQIYVMRNDGSEVKRITFGDGRYGTPVWSPRGDLIAFTKIYNGLFHIGVIRPDGQGERILTESFLDEGPTWSPNGRVLMFFRGGRTRADGSGGETRLWSIDPTGYNERLVPTPGDASDPAWSPLIDPGQNG